MSHETLKDVQLPGVRVDITLTRESSEGFLDGRPNPDQIDSLVDSSYEGAAFMSCGPTGLMDMVEKHALSKGVKPEAVLRESFQ